MDSLVIPCTTQKQSGQQLQLGWSRPQTKSQHGRTQQRETPFSQITNIPETPPSQRSISRGRGRPITPRSNSRARSQSRRLILGELPTTDAANHQVFTTESVRVLKGGFVITTPSTEYYKYPKARSQPESTWRAGDGFSEEEAATDFLFYATGKRKRKRSSTLPRMGKLFTGVEETESRSIRPSNKRSRGIGMYENLELLRGEQREAWPTRADFEDCTLPPRRERELTILDHNDADTIIPATSRPQRERSTDSRSTVKYVSRLEKGALDFANFPNSGVMKSTFLEDNLLSQIRIPRTSSVSAEEEDNTFYEDDDKSTPEDGSQVDGDCENHGTSYASTRASSPSGAYWDEHGNHVFPEDEVYDEYGDDMND